MMRTLLVSFFMACAVSLAAQVNKSYESHIFCGSLNGKIPVEIAWQENAGDRLAGYIYYPEAKTPAPILIVGRYGKVSAKAPNSENLYKVHFTEYQPDGSVSGKITLSYTEVEGDYEFVSGSWTHPLTGKVMPMRNGRSRFELPSWFVKTPETLDAPERSAYSFRHSFEKDKDGWLQTIHVESWAEGRKTGFNDDYELFGAFDNYQETNLDWVSEEDINFDGIPDVMVFIGLVGRGGTQSNYAAYVWNADTRMFYKVENFSDIAEPAIDAKAKTITSVDRGIGCLYIDTYKWKNGKLVKVKSTSPKM